MSKTDWQNFAVSAEEDPVKRETSTTLFCGLRNPPPFAAQQKVVNVIFKSGQWRTNTGFRGTYHFQGHPGVYWTRSSTTKSTTWSAGLTLLALFMLSIAQTFSSRS
ncbi:hypothetical protein BV898_02533 [Hypsibius exemplaris]|nr:hypothetical protein BV898_02533 [Hypsibius exemplaris]